MRFPYTLAISATSAAVVVAVLFLFPVRAQAVDLGVKVEAGAAAALSAPQSQLFAMGGGPSAKAMVGLGRYADAAVGAGFLGLPASGAASSEAGTAWTFGGGLRVKRPHDATTFRGASPWVDADALYVRTGPLNRFGFAAAAGVSVPVDDARRFWVGPFVRYLQVLQEPSRDGYDNRDLKALMVGLGFEAGTSPMPAPPMRRTVTVMPEPVRMPDPVVLREPERDFDHDGVFDKDDNCGSVSGPASNGGCPVYEKVIVKPDKLELTEKIQFAFDKALIEPASYPALDAVVVALQDNKGFRVAIEGHASSEGLEARNQTLSEQRAEAVLEYLANHGVARSRLASKGFSSGQPLESNRTNLGREANRRVEFVVQFIILEKGSIQ